MTLLTCGDKANVNRLSCVASSVHHLELTNNGSDFRHKSICGRRQTPYHGTATSDDAFSESKFATDPESFPWMTAVHVGDEVCSGVYVSHRDIE